MKKELELQLVERFPDMLREYGGDPMTTCMSWGFEHGDGWFELVKNLLVELDILQKEHNVEIVIAQVKSKFSSLRVYIDHNGSKEIGDIIHQTINRYEDKSRETCEITGQPGKHRVVGGWHSTLCDEEYEKLLARNKA